MLGCNVPVTLVRHIGDKDGDRYECVPVSDVSWFRKEIIAISAEGAKPVNTCVCRIPVSSLNIAPETGDYLVHGSVQGVNRAPQDFGTLDYMQITSVGDNRRGGLPHWRVSGS